MCFDADAVPPPPPGLSGPVPPGEAITLSSTDGVQVMAHHAKAEHPTGAGIVILPDVRGLFDFYRRLAEQFAAVGVDAVAIDYFARTAGPEVARSNDWDFWPHVQQTRPDQVRADVAAAVSYLRAQHGVASVFAVGFCFGGGNAFCAAAGDHGLAGVIGFYGNPVGRGEWYPSAMDRVADMTCPVLGLFGGADEGIPPETVAAFDEALVVEHELVSYPGAPHSFFDRSATSYADECADAWRRTLDFVAAHR